MEQPPLTGHDPIPEEASPHIQESLLEAALIDAAIAEAREKSAKKHPVRNYFIIQNVFVIIAAFLFFVSVLPEHIIGSAGVTLRAIAYFMGAVAYFAELLMLTHGFKKKIPFHEMYMPYVFGILYVLLCINYLFFH